MRKYNYLSLLAFTITLALASCNKQDCFVSPHDNEVRITSGIATRTVGNTWENNDRIGVCMNAAGGELGALGANIEHSTDGSGNFTAVTASKNLFYPVTGNVDLLAYYPYVENVDATAYDVDVTNQSDQGAIDLLVAKEDDVAKSSNAVNLAFDHKLSRIELTIVAGIGLQASDLIGLEVKLVGTDPEAQFNLISDEINLSGTKADITLLTAADGQSSEAIVVPQTLSEAKLSFKTAAFGTFETNITTAAFLIGKNHKYTVTLSHTAKLGTAEISPWGAGNSTGDNLDVEMKLPASEV